MQRITITVSDEVMEWLAERAKAEDRSLSRVAWHALQTQMLISDMPEYDRPGRAEEQPVISDKGPALTHTTALIPGKVWDFACGQARLHRAGIVCPSCGGSGPR